MEKTLTRIWTDSVELANVMSQSPCDFKSPTALSELARLRQHCLDLEISVEEERELRCLEDEQKIAIDTLKDDRSSLPHEEKQKLDRELQIDQSNSGPSASRDCAF
ncbi:hypothetical protein AYL99_09940 [Fonsecaea erecta]|uniref:Uncharacterized protein n=1 Tax=Fonsecaea erecta TaxID=1367422 RepID=A0A178Z7L9_9EURO|nr:hypothetical protein AYL99_09940 [Fonsecaea erecta]OAP55788.1 hypothetical protein AYL99_09940 [Fonsecaea erecta]